MKYKIALYYIAAFLGSAIVTYYLPGTEHKFAFVDVMGVLLSLVFLAFGIFYAVITADNYTKGQRS